MSEQRRNEIIAYRDHAVGIEPVFHNDDKCRVGISLDESI